ncbi:hypothetical protein DRE_00839 [Drechslerella stenobrocha 248]|uniref:tRNA(Ile)-lysidine synthetase n=1 Tax=Drechslerella stenobrocha 248 TaxID=1043628 RepID=W7I8S3_9PEZI|nr:hypothetical protein DRE_00839 [Drechslerella stenobrocha 248]
MSARTISRLLHTSARHMGSARPALAPMFSPADFEYHLIAALKDGAALQSQKFEIPKRIALGVSGGIDSMALAHLAVKQKIFDSEFGETEFVAIVMDHGLRGGSGREADEVAAATEKMGLRTHRVDLKWDHKDPKATDIEHHARQLRYRQFARLCIELDIAHIVTAHHGNDQAETVLMRLLEGSGRAGLAGMRSAAVIPECQEIYGAEKILLLRPFLVTLKERLQQTLMKDKVRWFEDPTNSDVSLTPRNAIRALISGNNLDYMPKAIRTTSLMAFAQRIHEQNKKDNKMVDWYLSRCYLRHVRESAVVECLIPVEMLNFPPQFLARVVGRLAEVVSPLERVDMKQMASVVDNILGTRDAKGDAGAFMEQMVEEAYAKSAKEEAENAPSGKSKKKDFRRWEQKMRYAGGAFTENNVFWEAAYCPKVGRRQEGVLLQCYRQPYTRASLKRKHDTPEMELEPSTADEWKLWDGRFWIRFLGGKDHPVWDKLRMGRVKRVFLTGTRKEVTYQLGQAGLGQTPADKRSYKQFRQQLKFNAPGKSRSVLPVVCEEMKSTVKKWKVPYSAICFPTFGIGNEVSVLGNKWEWRPKKDFVVGGRLIGNIPTAVAAGRVLPL